MGAVGKIGGPQSPARQGQARQVRGALQLVIGMGPGSMDQGDVIMVNREVVVVGEVGR